MTAMVTIYPPTHGPGGARGASGGANVRPVGPVDRTDSEHRFARESAGIPDLARKVRDAADQARAIVEYGGSPHRGGEEKPGRTLMSAFGHAPSGPAASDSGRAAVDFVYRTVEEFGSARFGRGFLFDIEI